MSTALEIVNHKFDPDGADPFLSSSLKAVFRSHILAVNGDGSRPDGENP